MAPTVQIPKPQSQPNKSTKSNKLPKLPRSTLHHNFPFPTPQSTPANNNHPDSRVEKRPLIHPAIPSPYTNASSPKVIYISTKTPFISAVKRVRALLTQIEKRSTPKLDLINGKGSNKQKLQALAGQKKDAKGKEPEAVILKGTNKAITKVCELALFFQGQDDVQVRIKTGSVGTVDDIVEKEVGEGEWDGIKDDEDEEEEELPESRVRWLSVVEAYITLK